MDVDNAKRNWELQNQVVSDDSIYEYDAAKQSEEQGRRAWANDPHHFTSVRISSLALLKMTMHARSGGNIEVMGLMQGKIQGKEFIVMDAFALPVEGTETRVNAQAEAYTYMVEYMRVAKESSRLENAIGWYHSHPGYGCWLSGIDVGTQKVNQQYQEPWLAIVIDPTRTVAAGKVEIGAFRTYPDDYKPPNATPSGYQTIPIDKIKDFGVHESQYYPLDISYFKSSLDAKLFELLWNKYWVNTLSSSPLLANTAYNNGQIRDIANKLDHAESSVNSSGKAMASLYNLPESNSEESPLNKICRDSINSTMEQVHGIMSQVVKSLLFNLNNHNCDSHKHE